MTGGGSGGHITPILAVAKEIKQQQSDAWIGYIGQRGDVFGEVVAESNIIDSTYTVQAGKFRRYHGLGIGQFFDVKTTWLNLRDAFRTVAGIAQAIILLHRLKPDVVFCKGGFVGVPVGLAAAFLRVPYVTHDSDAIPGLANRIIARWATMHAVALEAALYSYDQKKTVSTGVPVHDDYSQASQRPQKSVRTQLGIEDYGKVLLITGGGLGAARLNTAVLRHVGELLERFPDLCIIHNTGQLQESEISAAYTKCLTKMQRRQVIVRGFVTNLHEYMAAADVVVARGGATSFAELALQEKPCIIVPNPLLTGGHQLKNALAYEKKNAIVCVQEADILTDSTVLLDAVTTLLGDDKKRAKLAGSIRTFAKPNATRDLANILLKVATSGSEER
ncbi:MAG: UDP-N-acetylglucosamine--N-acetylmuramyl-(Pentapeptide) pyrophosphoryl-undecaprenol [Patescibacteria group bacterium]|nr:UDP-N-acetylglucosamine--N-acetylmuramyl-(Pentapeptide) pyrophosphoryl-undecaprenol [Patescibacteria group bacterium]